MGTPAPGNLAQHSDARRRSRMRWLALSLLVVTSIWGLVFALQADKRRAQPYLEAGIEFARIGEGVKAEHAWREALRFTPNSPILWELLGEYYLSSEHWSKGKEAFTHLAELTPEKPSVYARLAACCLRTGDEQAAYQYAHEELKRNSKDSASLAMLAFLSEMQDDVEKQVEYLQRLLVNLPDDAEYLRSLALAQYKQGKIAEMLPLLEHLIRVSPKDAVAYAMRGMARLETEPTSTGLKQAEADLLHALELQSSYPFARFTLGRLYVRQRQYEKAIPELELAESLNPHQMNAPFELATAYERTGQKEKADAARRRFDKLRVEATEMSILQKRCSLQKDDFDSHLALGKLTQSRQDYRQASYYIKRALTLRPDSKEAKEAYEVLLAQLQETNPFTAARTESAYGPGTKTP